MSDPIIALLGLTTIFLISEKKTTQKRRKLKVDQKRTPVAVSKSTKKALDLVTIDPKTFPVGSYKFRAHSYPSDIDIFEIVKRCCSIPTAVKQMVSAFKDMARKIKRQKNVFLGDFKAGLDSRFEFDWGELDYKDGEAIVVGYKPALIRSKIRDFRDANLISNDEYKKVLKLVKSRLSPYAFYELEHKYLREWCVVRWSLDEMIKGEKKIRGGKVLTLAEAITHDTIVKIDIWSKVDERYIEVTNFFLLVAKDRKGKETVINEELKDRMGNLDKDIKKYSSTTFRNSLKLAKRYWNKAVWLGDNRTMKKVYPLFRSGAAALNQVAEDAGLIVDMLERGTHPPISELYNQIDGFKHKIDNIFDIKFKRENMYKLIDNTIKRRNTKNTIKQMDKLVKEIKQIVEFYSYQYMTKLNIVKGKYKKTIEELDDKDHNYPDLSGFTRPVSSNESAINES